MNGTFDISKFNSIKGIIQRRTYAATRLRLIGKGSSREVYLLNDERCLKIACNAAGLAQNRAEGEALYNGFDICAKVFERSENFEWLVCELCGKAHDYDFEELFPSELRSQRENPLIAIMDYMLVFGGFTVDGIDDGEETPVREFNTNAIRNFVERRRISNPRFASFIESIDDWIGASFPGPDKNTILDLCNISNWGIAIRNGIETPVIVDYGINEDVFSRFY